MGRLKQRGLGGPALAATLALGTAGCDLPRAVDPSVIYDQVSGNADARRERPPGQERPFPNLASVPPRPSRPEVGAREALMAALAADRERSREPQGPRLRDAPPAAGVSPGVPPMPAAPPAPARLSNAPTIPWGAGGGPRPRPGAPPAPPDTTAPLITPDDSAPAAPPPDLLGLPPPRL